MPVWPVARKSTSVPRSANARAIDSAVYFLPSAQSVPTVSSRFPLRFSPVAIGIFSGGGIPMDAVVSDFAAGAAEMLSPAAAPDHWDVIEGQGSILHPAYAGVSLALLHGSQPDVFVVCHDPSRTCLLGDEEFAVPPVEEIIELTIALGRRTNPAIRCGGISLNTSALDEAAAIELCRSETARLGLPVADPIRGGTAFDDLIAECLKS